MDTGVFFVHRLLTFPFIVSGFTITIVCRADPDVRDLRNGSCRCSAATSMVPYLVAVIALYFMTITVMIEATLVTLRKFSLVWSDQCWDGRGCHLLLLHGKSLGSLALLFLTLRKFSLVSTAVSMVP